jgi:hypothetical protein
MVLDTTSMALDDAAKVVCQAACAFWSKREAAP